MKNISFFGTVLLVATLSACSSGSSNDPDAATSTNTVPNLDNAVEAGSSTAPSEDQPSTAGGSNSGSGDNGTDSTSGSAAGGDGADTAGSSSTAGNNSSAGSSDGDNTGSGTTDGAADSGNNDGGTGDGSDAAGETGGSDTSGGSDGAVGNDTGNGSDGSDGSGGGDTGSGSGTDSTGNDSDGSNTDTAGDTTDGGSSDTDGGTSGAGNGGDSNPSIDPESSLGQLQSRVNELAGRSLVALNQSLSQGEMLTAQQDKCLGTYDPGIGEPLLSINCERALSIDGVPIYAAIASLKDTPECRASLQNGNADACVADQASISANALFTRPDNGTPRLKFAGAAISYNIVQDRLIVENLEKPRRGIFRCEYNLTNGNEVTGNPGVNCDNQLNTIRDLIDEHLSKEN